MADTEGGRRRRAPQRPGDEPTSELGGPARPSRAKKAPAARKAPPLAKAAPPAKKATPARKKAAPAAKKMNPMAPAQEAQEAPEAPAGSPATSAAGARSRRRTPPPLEAPVTTPRTRTRKKAAEPAAPAAPLEPLEPAADEFAPEPEPEPEWEPEPERPAGDDRRAGIRALLAEAAARAAAEREQGTAGTAPMAPTPPRFEPVERAEPEELEEPEEPGPWEAPASAPAMTEPQTATPTPEPTAVETRPEPPPKWEPTVTAETAVISPPPTPATPPPTAAPPTKPPKERRRRAGDGRTVRTVSLIVGIAVLVGLLLVGGLILVNSLTDEGGVRYSELQPGDCFQRPSGQFNNVTTVACTERHDLEVYAVLDHPDPRNAPFPGMETLVRYANPLCLAQFRSYAGVPFEQLNLQDVYITPRDSAWRDGARRIVCAVGSGNDEPLTRSIRAGTP